MTWAFNWLWQHIVYYATFQFLDPAWQVAGVAILITVIVLGALYFFGGLNKWVKPIGGLIVAVAWAMFWAFRRGEKAARKHDQPIVKPKSKPKPEPRWKWPWE